MCASTRAANARRSRARSPGAPARQAGKARAAASIASSVPAGSVGSTCATNSSVAGFTTSMVLEPLEAAEQLPVGDRRVEGGQLHPGVVGVVLDDLVAERFAGERAALPQGGRLAQGRRYPGRVGVGVGGAGVGLLQRQLPL